ncbi:GMC family oxidoreductase [Roseovarius sp. S1116L3]|uniref:GMC family oxidoreductase n=1 Tax=Roseovarius roseus TaxID=3342636 RepID=UPI0037291A6B
MQDTEFDYIIVGAGSAGCVLAERLTQGGRLKVLLLEAGGSDARMWVKIPIGYAMNFANPAVNWGYHAEADEGLAGRSAYWPRGRVVGGCGSINAMAYLRGLPHDFDDWSRAGATGWDWEKVRAVYDRMERHSATPEEGGPVWVQDLSDQMHPFSRHFLRAAQEAGYCVTDDINRSDSGGIGYYRSTVRRGLRWSSADAFLRPALRRKNLRMITRAHVQRLEFDGARVCGITYSHKGQTHQVRAGRGVILSAGAINSPQILQLSGIGPADLLKSRGIEVRRDLGEVGQGLQDHLAVSFQFHATQPTLNSVLGRNWGKLRAGAEYLLRRKGPLAVPVNQVGGFVRTSPEAPKPDMQLFCNPASYEITAEGRAVLDRAPGYLLSAQPCRPTSRGSVIIRSADYRDAPAIQPNSLSTSQDRQAAIRAGRILQGLARTNALRAVTKGCKKPEFAAMDEDALLQEFRNRASTVYHPSCTCRMGKDAGSSVVNARLEVHGVPGLRVVDASAFPNVTSGNINAPTMMLSMQAADMILQDAG